MGSAEAQIAASHEDPSVTATSERIGAQASAQPARPSAMRRRRPPPEPSMRRLAPSRRRPSLSIREVMGDRALLGHSFSGSTWSAWRALLSGFDGLALSNAEAQTFHGLTGRNPPKSSLDELWMVVGRRGGKSIIAALLAVHAACFYNYKPKLAAGKVATVMVLAADRRQARTVYRHISGLLRSSPMLARMIERETVSGIELTNRVQIDIHTASFRTVLSDALAAAILDEVAFWLDGDANPASEILEALRPGLATLEGRLIAFSSPHARRGPLWETHRAHYGQPGRILVAQAPTRTMNPAFPRRVVDEALERDELRARAEYLAEFRSDVEIYVAREVVEALVPVGVHERAPLPDTKYVAFVHPSGRSSDSFTLAIAHRGTDGEAILDLLRERKSRFNPEAVVGEYAMLLKRYGVSYVTGDRCAGERPRAAFRKHEIEFEVAASSKGELYRDLLPLLNSGQAELLENERLVKQFSSLERRTSCGGCDSIDHSPNAHDDVANAVAGALLLAAESAGTGDWSMYSLEDFSDGEKIKDRDRLALESRPLRRYCALSGRGGAP